MTIPIALLLALGAASGLAAIVLLVAHCVRAALED